MATSPAPKGLPEGHASLFFASAAAPPASSSSRPRGIPLESFLAVMHEVRRGSEYDLVEASHVCTGWRKAIVECGQLWSELEGVDVTSFTAVERVRAVSSRARDHLRRLTLHFDAEDPMMCTTMAIVLKQIFREVSRHGARGLEELVVDLESAQDLMEDLEPAYACVVLAAQFSEFSAVNLKTLRIVTSLNRYPAGAPFFFALPQLDKLVLTSSPTDPYDDARLPDFFSTSASLEAAQLTSCSLRTLILSGTSLMDSTFPDFPQLRTLKLFKVRVSNLYGLLVKAPRLETLWLRQVQTDPANRFLPAPADGGVKDVPPPLELPSLRHLCIAGPSPLLWLPPTQTTSHFVVVTAWLETVDLGKQRNFDLADDENWGPHFAAPGLTKEALATLFRNSPHLAKLRLTGHNATTDILSPAIRHAAPETLTTLLVGGTTFANDAVVDRLGPKLLPNLEWLDVFHPGGQEANQVTVQALARLAERYQKAKGLQRWLSLWDAVKLTLVTNEPVMDDEPSTSDLRTTLRNLLVTLSPAQVAHLPSQLKLNAPPGALSFAVVAHEVTVLPLPPQRPPYVLRPDGKWSAAGDPLDEVARAAAARKKRAGAADAGAGGGAGAGPVPRPVADQAMVDEARRAMQRWHTRREQEQAVAWCGRAEGVELRWGVGCSDDGCDCGEAHPGAREWLRGAEEEE